MSRAIKFRGRRMENGEWMYGSYTHCHDESGNVTIIPFRANYFVPVDASTVGQYTGLKDRKGAEIYEGDIVRYPDAYMNGEDGDWDEIVSTGVIAWDDDQAQFYVTNRNSIDVEDFWEQIDEAEVIGNIHEHPNLLGEEQ